VLETERLGARQAAPVSSKPSNNSSQRPVNVHLNLSASSAG
jgi:hypothetical protein